MYLEKNITDVFIDTICNYLGVLKSSDCKKTRFLLFCKKAIFFFFFFSKGKKYFYCQLYIEKHMLNATDIYTQVFLFQCPLRRQPLQISISQQYSLENGTFSTKFLQRTLGFKNCFRSTKYSLHGHVIEFLGPIFLQQITIQFH